MKLLAPCALLIVFATLVVTSMSQQSATSDEVVHLPAGYTFLQTGDFRMSARDGHPPLIEALAAVPLLALDLKPIWESPAWRTGDVWAFGGDFLANNREPLWRILFLGRLPVAVLGILTAMVLFVWARELWGDRAAVFVLLLFTFCPTMLAHSGLATNDVGLTCLTLFTVYSLWRFSLTGRPVHAGYCGLALGLALLSKYSGVTTLAVVAALLAATAWFQVRPSHGDDNAALPCRVSFPALFRAALLIGFMVAVTITIGFGFPKGLVNYIAGLRVRAEVDRNQVAFLWGEYVTGGFWYYFLLAQLWKTPIPTLLCFCGALLLIDVRRRTDWLRWLFLLVPIAAFHAAGMLYGVNIGIRHMLPAFPFLFLASGATAQWVASRRAAYKVAFALLCIWYVVGTLRVSPHFIAYFNELAGGPDNGVYYLGDSNIEWGQDLYGVKQYIDATRPSRIGLAVASTIPPERYGVPNEPIKLRDLVWPQEGVTYFVGAQYLQRRSYYQDNPALRFHWLERYAPIDKIGWSIYVYRVSTDPADRERPDMFYIAREKWYGDAADTLSAIVSHSPDFREARELLAEVYFERAQWLDASGRMEAALLDYLNAVHSAPHVPAYREQFRDMIVKVQAGLEVNRDAASVHCMAGVLRARADEIGAALRSLLACLKGNPQRLDARTSLGNLYWRIGLGDLARQEWEQCLRIDPGYAPARQHLAQMAQPPSRVGNGAVERRRAP